MRKIAILILAVSAIARAQCTYSKVTPSTFASTLSGAPGGSTLCLTAGTFTFNQTTKSSMVTIQPDSANGGTQSNVIVNATINTSQYITFSNLTFSGGVIGVSGGSPGQHIHILNSIFTGSLCITPSDVNLDVLISGNTFGNIGQSCTEGRLGISGDNVNHNVVNGIVITNNLFTGPGGTGGSGADGININGGAYGTYIGPGNTFTGILEGGCGSVHCDSIQFYGAINTTVTGNFFINDSDAIMSPDCNGSPMTVTNNVFVQDPTSATNEVIVAGGNGDVFDHNTFGSSHSSPRFGNPNSCGLNTNITLTNNILMGGIDLTDGQSTSTFTQNYNLIPGGGTGAQTISGSPTFVGGSAPNTYSGFLLTSTSPGYLKGTSGTSIGIPSSGSGTPPTAPAPPTDLGLVVK